MKKIMFTVAVLFGMFTMAEARAADALFAYDLGYVGSGETEGKNFIRTFSPSSSVNIAGKNYRNPRMLTATFLGPLTPAIEQCLANARQAQTLQTLGKPVQLIVQGKIFVTGQTSVDLNVMIGGDLDCRIFTHY